VTSAPTDRQVPDQVLDMIDFLETCGTNTSPEFKGIKTPLEHSSCQFSQEQIPALNSKGLRRQALGVQGLDAGTNTSPEFKGIKTAINALNLHPLHEQIPALNSKGLRPQQSRAPSA
jgi:hypothetical protein